MITAEILKQYATKKGVKIEENFPQSFTQIRGEFFIQNWMNRYIAKTTYCYQVGILFQKNTWYWWNIFILVDDETYFERELYFDNAYNMNTGVTHGIRKGITAEEKIIDFLSKN